MEFLEKDLEEIIFNATKDQLFDADMPLLGKRFRQVRLGCYGVCDILHVYRDDENVLTFEVLELKKEKIGISAFLQAVKYIKGIQQYLKKVKNRRPENYNYEITLVGRSVDTSGSFIFLPDIVSNCIPQFRINLFTYKYGFDGIYFVLHDGYELTEEGF